MRQELLRKMATEKPLKVLFLYTSNAGVTFYRIYQFARNLYRVGCEVVMPFPDFKSSVIAPLETNFNAWDGRITQRLAYCADVVVCGIAHSEVVLALISYIRFNLRKPVLMEIDDYLFNVPPYNSGSMAYYPCSLNERRAAIQMKDSDGIICSTTQLADMLRPHNSNCYVVPNGIDWTFWQNSKPIRYKKKPGVVRILWSGSAGHQANLEMVLLALQAILDKYPQVELYFQGPLTPPIYNWTHKRVKLDNRWVWVNDYPAYLRGIDADIGIAPLINSQFNQAKSALRYLQFTAAGVPVVASPVGEVAELVKEGKTGLLAVSQDEWVNKLSVLIEDEVARKRMVKDAVAITEGERNITNIVVCYGDILRQVYEENKIRSEGVCVGDGKYHKEAVKVWRKLSQFDSYREHHNELRAN